MLHTLSIRPYDRRTDSLSLYSKNLGDFHVLRKLSFLYRRQPGPR